VLSSTIAQADTLPCGSVRSRTTYQSKASGTASPVAFPRAHAHEHMQVLSNAEETTLVRWITHLTVTGFPASPSLAIAIAEEIWKNRYQVARLPPSYPRPIGKNWLDRFRARHPDIQGIWTRKIDGARHKAISVETVKTWFDAVTELRLQHKYTPERIYNMDESGFAVGESQSSRALVNIREMSSWKVVPGRQQWITAIECISAGGSALPPLLIFKAKHTNTGWIPTSAPRDWRFSTSNSGWTSDSHAYEWLTTVFEPSTRPADPTLHRLPVMDGHGSHITTNVIAHCMKHAIDLLILPPHTSHMLQPLDVSVFGPLKRALAKETDAVSRVDYGRIQRVEWTEMYIRARENAFTSANIVSGWRATGLNPLSPITVLEKLVVQVVSRALHPTMTGELPSLDTSLLNSSPPDGTELRQANTLFIAQVQEATGLPSPAKRFAKRMTHALETTQSELVTVRKELAEHQKLIRSRRYHSKGKRVKLKGRFVYSTQEVLAIAQEAEAEVSNNKGRRRPQKRSVSLGIDSDEDDVIANVLSDYESDCIVVATRVNKWMKLVQQIMHHIPEYTTSPGFTLLKNLAEGRAKLLRQKKAAHEHCCPRTRSIKRE
jgi:hypothetical protein